MNWTGGKRNKIKVKLELQKQKEFFNRQRLKKVHSFLNIEPRRTRTLTSIEVVRRNETPRNNFLSNDYFNVDKKLLLDKTCKDSIILDIDNDDPDFTKRKQFLLQDNDWAGFEFTVCNLN
ncbi:hypothetical protein RclHR1_01920028 [Rhizophagus clarus]|uniref:Uncharacterized protein n=1 Tax=Rhizophagus clarus TaxID=94130 RepID=A0A2Z6R2H5_9GLOM|nr:hypothetical protein RclHR1_01920028 [Rhizophagus clarus]